MFTTGPKVDVAIELMGFYGFEYRQVMFVWNK